MKTVWIPQNLLSKIRSFKLMELFLLFSGHSRNARSPKKGSRPKKPPVYLPPSNGGIWI